jgi:LysM repeat protein
MIPYLHSSKRQSTIDIATSLEEANAVKANTLRTYIIRKGDSLYRIARKYGVTVAALCKANKIKSTKILKPGQRLVIGL